MKKPLVGIIMGSDSDLPVMKDAAKTLKDAGIEYEMTIVSAHRTPKRLVAYAQTAVEKGLKVIIAGAGGAAANILPAKPPAKEGTKGPRLVAAAI